MSVPAKVQAMEALIDAHARELHLPTVRARFRGLAEEATRDQQTPTAYLAALLVSRAVSSLVKFGMLWYAKNWTAQAGVGVD